MHWKRIANLLAAFALALGGHYITENTTATAIADVVAVVIAQNNRELSKPTEERRRAE